jgi:thiol-disulfide isomerase/thioredoxin
MSNYLFKKRCIPCAEITPLFKKLSERYNNINFIEIDVDDVDDNLDEAISKYEVFVLPTFLFVANNQVIDRLSGSNSNILKRKTKGLSFLNEEASNEQIFDNKILNQEAQKSILKKKDSAVLNFREKTVNLIKRTNHLNQLVQHGKTICIFSSKWCYACKNIRKFLDQLAEKYCEIKFVEVDVEAMDEDFDKVFTNIKISVLPTFLFYNQGKVIDRISGSDPIELNRKTENLMEF